MKKAKIYALINLALLATTLLCIVFSSFATLCFGSEQVERRHTKKKVAT